MNCSKCKQSFALSGIQRFIVATGQSLRSLQLQIVSPESPAFVRLLQMMVTFLDAAFARGSVPSVVERRDALACMREIKYFASSDGAMRIIFTSDDDIQFGVNEERKNKEFDPQKYVEMFGAWVALQEGLKAGVALR